MQDESKMNFDQKQSKYFITATNNQIVFNFHDEADQLEILNILSTRTVSGYYNNTIKEYNPDLKEKNELKMPMIYPNDKRRFYFPYYLNLYFEIEINFGERGSQESEDPALKLLRLLEITKNSDKNVNVNDFIYHYEHKPNCLSFNNSAMIFLDPNFYFCSSNGELKEQQFIGDKITRESIMIDTPRGKKLINAINRDDIKIHRRLYRGNHDLFVGEWKNITVVIKDPGNALNQSDIIKEAAIIACVESSSLVDLVGVILEKPYSLVVKFMPHGNLFDLIYGKKELPWPIRCQIALDIAIGLEDLHNNNIWYVDLKSANILVDEDNHIKLADFGSSLLKSGKIACDDVYRQAWHWTPPEFYDDRVDEVSKATDIYSFGMVLWELITRRLPPPMIEINADGDIIFIGKDLSDSKNSRHFIPKDTPKELIKIMEDCLSESPDRRPIPVFLCERLNKLCPAESKRMPRPPPLPEKVTLKYEIVLLICGQVIDLVQGVLARNFEEEKSYYLRNRSKALPLKEKNSYIEEQIYHALTTAQCAENKPAFARRIWSDVVSETRGINLKKLVEFSSIKQTLIARLERLGFGLAAEFIIDQAPKYLKKSGVVTWPFNNSRLGGFETKQNDHDQNRELDLFKHLSPKLLQLFKENPLARPRRGRLILPDRENIPGVNGNSFITLFSSDQMLFFPEDYFRSDSSAERSYTPCSFDTIELLLLKSSDEWLNCIAFRICFKKFPKEYDAYRNYIEVLIPSQLSLSEVELLYIHETKSQNYKGFGIIKTLKEEGINLNIINSTVNPYLRLRQQFITAIAQDKKEKADCLLKKYPTLVNISNDRGYSPMGIAAQHGSALVLEWLISKYSAEHKCRYKISPLQIAMLHNQSKALRLLLETEADVNLVLPIFYLYNNTLSYDLFSPLYTAIHFNSDEKIIHCLLNYGADPNQKIFLNRKQTTPLQLALRQRQHIAGLLKNSFWKKIKLASGEVTTCASIEPRTGCRTIRRNSW